jgi:hypothetical protein
MTNRHLSDEALQIFAMGQPSLDAAMKRHIESCTACQEQIAVYKLILSGIKDQPAAAIDFDLAGAVLSRVQPFKTKALIDNFYSVISILLVAAIVSIPLYIFRKNFLNLTAGISGAFLLISMITCISIIGFKVVKLYHKYYQQIKKLNFSK